MTEDEPIKRIDIAEFRALGYLQEVNRLVLHPCGLALEVIVEEDGTESLGGVWDYRDDPEGMTYDPGMIDPFKVMGVENERRQHSKARIELFNSIVQLPNWPASEKDT